MAIVATVLSVRIIFETAYSICRKKKDKKTRYSEKTVDRYHYKGRSSKNKIIYDYLNECSEQKTVDIYGEKIIFYLTQRSNSIIGYNVTKIKQ